MSRSSNDTAEAADSDDVDSGVSPEHVHAQDCLDSQESDVAISFLCFVHYGIGALRMRNGRMGVTTHYARNYAYANSFLLCLKLCQHIVHEPSEKSVAIAGPTNA